MRWSTTATISLIAAAVAATPWLSRLGADEAKSEVARRNLLTVEKTDEAITVKQPDGRLVCQYQLVRPAEGAASVESGCYFHPLATPSGVVVTEVGPADHAHHRGAFLAWVETHGRVDADFWGWGERAPIERRKLVNDRVDNVLSLYDISSIGGGAFVDTDYFVTFQATNKWEAEGDTVLVEVLRALVAPGDGANVFRLTYTLTPGADLTIARSAFSGFCVQFRKDGELTAEGPEGKVDLPNPVHTDPETDWPDAAWYAYSIKLSDGKTLGAAVLNHPENPKTLWHNHRDARMLNPCIVAPAAVTIKANETLKLRYKVVTFDGDTPRKLLNELSEEWYRNE